MMDKVSVSPPELYHLPGFHEPFSAASHLIGAAVFLVLGLFLLRRGWGDRRRGILLAVYVVSGVTLLSLSGVYHMLVRGGTANAVLQRLDYAAIFVLIAGTFTPTLGLLYRDPIRRHLLALLWIATATGIALKTVFLQSVPEGVGLACYLGLGWCGVFAGVDLTRRFGFAFIQPLLAGGLAYSLGGLVDFFGGLIVIPGVVHPHEICHVTVLVGLFLHWRFIWQFAGDEDFCGAGRRGKPLTPWLAER
jgi:channel protein (hemolysin III family)